MAAGSPDSKSEQIAIRLAMMLPAETAGTGDLHMSVTRFFFAFPHGLSE
jgi:hypothetical protein